MKTRLALLAIFPLLLLGTWIITPLRYLTCVIGNTNKAWNIAVMIDETCNVDANGRVNQTLSARAALAQERGAAWGCILCKILNYIQTNHCQKALQNGSQEASS